MYTPQTVIALGLMAAVLIGLNLAQAHERWRDEVFHRRVVREYRRALKEIYR